MSLVQVSHNNQAVGCGRQESVFATILEAALVVGELRTNCTMLVAHYLFLDAINAIVTHCYRIDNGKWKRKTETKNGLSPERRPKIVMAKKVYNLGVVLRHTFGGIRFCRDCLR
jgi:hypothetical protein